MSSHTPTSPSTHFNQSQTHIVTQQVKFPTAGFLDISGRLSHSLSHRSHFTLAPDVTREMAMTQLLILISLQHQACVVRLQLNMNSCARQQTSTHENSSQVISPLLTSQYMLYMYSLLCSHTGDMHFTGTPKVLLQKLFSGRAWNEGCVRILRASY